VGLKTLYWKARNAVTEADFTVITDEMKSKFGTKGEEVVDYLQKVSHWALFKVIAADLKLYDMKSNNLSEAVFAWTLAARDLSPYYCTKKILKDMFLWNNRQRDEAFAHRYYLTPAAVRVRDGEQIRIEYKKRKVSLTSSGASQGDTQGEVSLVSDSIVKGKTHTWRGRRLQSTCTQTHKASLHVVR
jgi:hypothetical protein